MAILATIKGWFRRERQEPLERPRDLPPRDRSGDGLHPYDSGPVQGADQTLGWRGVGGGGAF